MQAVYEAAGGSAGLYRLADAWHARVMPDEVVSHAFSHGFHPQHTERLAAYWIEALGGPPPTPARTERRPRSSACAAATACTRRWTAGRSPVSIRPWRKSGWPPTPLRQVLHDYFAWATTTTMSRYHGSADEVPDGLRIPRWSWDGLVSETETGPPHARG